MTGDSLGVRSKHGVTRVALQDITAMVAQGGRQHPYRHDAFVGIVAGIAAGLIALGDKSNDADDCFGSFPCSRRAKYKVPLRYGAFGLGAGLVVAMAGRPGWVRVELPQR